MPRQYVQTLQVVGVQISLAAVGEPTQNSDAERVIRTIKEEASDLADYHDFADASAVKEDNTVCLSCHADAVYGSMIQEWESIFFLGACLAQAEGHRYHEAWACTGGGGMRHACAPV